MQRDKFAQRVGMRGLKRSLRIGEQANQHPRSSDAFTVIFKRCWIGKIQIIYFAIKEELMNVLSL